MSKQCGDRYDWIGVGIVVCDRPVGHTGWHATGGLKWFLPKDRARDQRRRNAKARAIEFVRDLAADPRTLPWFETAKEIISKVDEP